jgi:hypothetical protein
MNGNLYTSKMHTLGLKRLVDLRGGLQGFNNNQMLQRILTWYVFSLFSSIIDSPKRANNN